MSQLVIMGVIENNHTEVSFHFEMDFFVFELPPQKLNKAK